MKKFLKISIIILSVFAIALAIPYFTYLIITKDAKLDESKLCGTGQCVIIYDDENNEITSASLSAQKKSISVENLQKHTIDAFIASEDRTFFKHNGLNYKRMLKALYKNITSGSFKEGASTISQQLIKNTHLSQDKTIKRKLYEIKLTRRLEKKYNKNQILEMYLNTIYFGHSCYGLQSASQFYFNKNADSLNLEESATIVGLLTSPNNFSPFKNPEKCLYRRKVVLNAMLECGYIDQTEFNSAVESPLNTEKNSSSEQYGDYIDAIFDELEELDFGRYTLSEGCIIKTYLNGNIQTYIEDIDYTGDNAVIITDNISGGVKAFKSTIGNAKRQPGSTVKPLFVYAPAIEEKLLTPFTRINDEKTDFNGYKPENYDKKYHGLVTVKDSIKNSYNIPAVKTLNSLTVKNCEKYLTAMDIKLEDDEKNLSLALGGMKYGLSLKELADKYSVFANGGNYAPSRFIKEIITKDGKRIYRPETIKNNVFSAGTCSLINEILIETTKSGTAKKLKNLNFDVASKTGTCGNAEGNTDAYTVSYTSEHCIAVWLGDKDNKRSEITGGNDCCKIMNEVLESIYAKHRPLPIDTVSGTSTITIDREEYEKNDKIILADPVCPKLNILTVKVLKGAENYTQSSKFSLPVIQPPSITVTNSAVNIELCHTKYYSFAIKRTNNGKTITIYDGKWKNKITDMPEKGIYTYTVTPYYDDGNRKFYGKTISLPSVNLTDEKYEPLPDIVNRDWFNQ